MAQQRLGALLVEMGLIDRARLESALAEQATSRKRLGKILVEASAISERRLVQALSRQLSIEPCEPMLAPIHERVRSMIPAHVAHTHAVLPMALRKDAFGESLFVATADPLDKDAHDESTRRRRADRAVRWLPPAKRSSCSRSRDIMVLRLPACGETSRARRARCRANATESRVERAPPAIAIIWASIEAMCEHSPSTRSCRGARPNAGIDGFAPIGDGRRTAARNRRVRRRARDDTAAVDERRRTRRALGSVGCPTQAELTNLSSRRSPRLIACEHGDDMSPSIRALAAELERSEPANEPLAILAAPRVPQPSRAAGGLSVLLVVGSGWAILGRRSAPATTRSRLRRRSFTIRRCGSAARAAGRVEHPVGPESFDVSIEVFDPRDVVSSTDGDPATPASSFAMAVDATSIGAHDPDPFANLPDASDDAVLADDVPASEHGVQESVATASGGVSALPADEPSSERPDATLAARELRAAILAFVRGVEQDEDTLRMVLRAIAAVVVTADQPSDEILARAISTFTSYRTTATRP